MNNIRLFSKLNSTTLFSITFFLIILKTCNLKKGIAISILLGLRQYKNIAKKNSSLSKLKTSVY